MNAARAQIPLSRWSGQRLLLQLAGGAAAWLIVAAACLLVGSSGRIGWPASAEVRGYRIEMVLLSSLVGAALGAAGAVYQAILRNPLADPYLLGVSGGASLAAYVWRFPMSGAIGGSALLALGQQGCAFAGAMAVVAIALGIGASAGRLEPITLLLVGVIMNAINGAAFLLLNALHPEIVEGAGGPMSFLVGGIQTSLTPLQERTATIVVGAGWILLLYLAAQLNALALGEHDAEALGIHVTRLRWIGLLTASIVTASAVSISGPIGFVGLICPHIVRRIAGADHRRLLPWSTALGAALLCAADAASRLLAGRHLIATLLPVGVLTALLGGPFFLVLLWESRRAR